MASLAGPLDSGMVLKAEVRWDRLNIFASLDTPMQLRKEEISRCSDAIELE